MPGIAPVAGPMATSIRACSYFMNTIMEAQPWKYDPACLHLNWNSYDAAKTLRIGVVMDDGEYTPWPPVRRMMNETAEKLRKAGVDTVPLRLPQVGEAIETTFRMYALDGCKVSRPSWTVVTRLRPASSLCKISSSKAASLKYHQLRESILLLFQAPVWKTSTR